MEQKRGEGKQRFKKGEGKLGQGVGALKRGGRGVETPYELCIISDLHFATLVNILPKLKYFVGRIYIKVSKKIHSVLLFS